MSLLRGLRTFTRRSPETGGLTLNLGVSPQICLRRIVQIPFGAGGEKGMFRDRCVTAGAIQAMKNPYFPMEQRDAGDFCDGSFPELAVPGRDWALL